MEDPTPPLLSSLRVATFLVYPSQPIGELARAVRNAVLAMKNDQEGYARGEPMIEYVAHRLRVLLPGSILDGFFSNETSLVPMPGHAPLLERGNPLWPTRRLCEALVNEGLGREVLPLVERIEAVPASHQVRRGELRASARRHYESIRVVPRIGEERPRLLLVDDVLTRGATMLGAATRIIEALPGAQVLGFAVARTRSDPAEIESAVSIRVHRIERWGEDDCNVVESGESLA